MYYYCCLFIINFLYKIRDGNCFHGRLEMKDFHQLFVEELKEIHSAESQCIKLIPEVMQAAKSMKLKESLKEYLEDTKNQATRLEQIGFELGEDFQASECDIMQGLIKEWTRIQQTHYEADVQDAAIIGFLQKIKHFEIASYGSLKTFAKHLKKDKMEDLLKKSIQEEGKMDKKLTEIAEGTLFSNGINVKACKRCA